MVQFKEDDTLIANTGCSTFTASYKIGDYGVSFSDINKTVSENLKCLYLQIEKNFEKVLEEGLPFMHAVDDPIKGSSSFNMLFGFFPNLDIMDSALDFNMTKFNESLYADMFVDSPLMNNVFKITSVYEYLNVASGTFFLLMDPPQIKVENNKIVVDLIDTIFYADIEVVDSTHIKFINLNRVDKSDVTYPEDINLTCIDENLGTENECFEDPYSDSTNSDKVFAEIIEKFLSETIEVGASSSEYHTIRFSGTELEFIGTIRVPEIKPIPLMLTVGDNTVSSSKYSPNIDISSYVDKSISLQFYSTDAGDSIYDSAKLIDKIKFK